MRRLLLGIGACMVVATANAGGLKWHTSLPDANAKAKAEGKLVFVEFTGSDWCPPCKALHKEVFSSSAFAEYAAGKYVLVELDFPRKKAQTKALKQTNKALAEEFQIEGYPTVIILDGDGKELHRQVGYSGDSAKAYIAKLEAATGG